MFNPIRYPSLGLAVIEAMTRKLLMKNRTPSIEDLYYPATLICFMVKEMS